MDAREYVRRALREATTGVGVIIYERTFDPATEEHPDAAIHWQVTGEEREGQIVVELEIRAKEQDDADAIAGDIHALVEGVAYVDCSDKISEEEWGAHRMVLHVPADVPDSA